MSTNGLITFRADGQDKTVYNHSGSYPSWLGIRIVEGLMSEVVTPEAVRALRVVDDTTPPTDEDIERYREFSSEGVYGNGQGLRDWYVLLRKTQGDIPAIFKAGVIEDGSKSGIHEWMWVIDLDACALHVHYNSGTLSRSYPLTKLPTKADLQALEDEAYA
jgi:hypothetical protein